MSRSKSESNPADTVEVRAAGGVLWRERSSVEVLIVHRPRYDDWSFPKGKCEPGEADEECALREVTEETGFTCELGAELSPIRYVDRSGRSKQVRYWAMQVVTVEAQWDDEVDVMCWVRPTRAARMLSYERDAMVLDSFARVAGC